MIALMLAIALTADQQPRVQILAFGAEWCRPCRESRADYVDWMKRSGWKFGINGHVRFVDCDREQVLMVEHGVEVLPTFVILRDGKEVKRLESYPGRVKLVQEYMAVWESSQ